MQTLEAAQELVRSRCKATPKLKFKRLNDYSIVSDCGKFYVSKCVVCGGTQYEVWFKDGPKLAIQLRQNLSTGEEAKAWASSIANAYRKGIMELHAPLSKEEIDRLKAT